MQDRREDGGFLGRPAWLWSLGALLLGLAASVLAAGMHQAALSRSERDQLALRAERSFAAVGVQLQNCGLMVRTVQALFLASDRVTPAEFDAIYSNLRPRELFPSLQAVAYSDRQRGGAGNRDSFKVVMVAPLAGNERLLGFDIGSQPANLRGVLRSAVTDQAAMSGAFTLLQRQNLPPEHLGDAGARTAPQQQRRALRPAERELLPPRRHAVDRRPRGAPHA